MFCTIHDLKRDLNNIYFAKPIACNLFEVQAYPTRTSLLIVHELPIDIRGTPVAWPLARYLNVSNETLLTDNVYVSRERKSSCARTNSLFVEFISLQLITFVF